MVCASCNKGYEAVNQHSACPGCGKRVGTSDETRLSEQHAEAKRRFEEWDTATAEQRLQSRRCRNYYDGRQWTAAEKQNLKARGQAAVVFNYAAKKIDYLTGLQFETRTDPKPKPRTPAHEDDVQAVEDALRYEDEAEDVDSVFAVGWEEMLIEGLAAAVIEHEITPGKDIRIPVRLVHWDRYWYDPHSREPDFSDGKYHGVLTHWDLEDCKAYYRARNDKAENFEAVLEQAVSEGESGESYGDKPTKWSDPKRKRLLVIEEYYQEREADGSVCWYVRHSAGSGFVVPPKKTGYYDEEGRDTCALQAVSGFIDQDGDTYARYGLMERLIWPQDEINKRRSKEMHAASVRQTMAEAGAIPDIDAFKAEGAKPDGVQIVRQGAMRDGSVKSEMAQDIRTGQIQLLGEALQAINGVGPDTPMIAAMGPGASGRARQMAQQAGMIELNKLREQLRGWKRRIWTQIWYRVRQFWTYEMWRRVSDESADAGYRFVGLNRQMTKGARVEELLKAKASPESALKAAQVPPQLLGMAMQAAMGMLQQRAPQMPPPQMQQMAQQIAMQQVMASPEMQQPFVAADVAKLKMDIILDEIQDVATIQHEELEELTKIGQMMVGAGQPYPLELHIEASGLRSDKKKRMLAILEKAKAPTPQAQQMQQMMQQLQQTMAQLQAELLKAQVAKTQSETAENVAQTAKLQAEAATLPAKAQAHQAAAMVDAARAGAESAMSVAPQQFGRVGAAGQGRR